MDVLTNTQEKSGGWDNINIILVDDVLSCPNILTNKNSNEFTYSISSSTVEIMPLSDKMSLKEQKTQNASGTLYSISCELIIPDQSPELDDFFNAYQNKDVILIGTKTDRTEKIYGSVLCPLKFTYKFEDGDKSEDGGSIRVQVNGNIPQKPVFR